MVWGNIRVILGLYWDNGRENGNYNLEFRVSGLGCRIQDLGFRVWDLGYGV